MPICLLLHHFQFSDTIFINLQTAIHKPPAGYEQLESKGQQLLILASDPLTVLSKASVARILLVHCH